jgi:hypothetical protein
LLAIGILGGNFFKFFRCVFTPFKKAPLVLARLFTASGPFLDILIQKPKKWNKDM